MCDLYNCARSLKESHGSRISFQLSCLFLSRFNTDSQVVGKEHMLTCQRSFHLFVIVEDLKEVVFLLLLFFVLFCFFLFSVLYIDTVQCQVKREP